MRKLNVLASLSLLLLVSVIHHNHAWAFPGPWPEYIFALSQSNPDNLLVNGNMEDLPFYWRYPNHYVAGGWSRWWIDGTVLPEYDDVRPGRPYRYDGHHAQVYFKWGNNYTAGIFQVVEGVTPCTPYRLSMWGRSHSLEGAHPHTKVGLDPTGSEVTPDGAVKHGLPPLTAWSREQTELFTWEELTVEAESLGEQMTAILYASPQPGSTATHYYDTFWDAGMLVPTNFPDGKLPTPSDWQPSGFIQNLSTTFLLDKILITWDTPSAASTQVQYAINAPQAPPPYPSATTLAITPTLQHQALITGLAYGGDEVRLAALSRRPTGDRCVTEVATQRLTLPQRSPPPEEWTPSGLIQNLSVTPMLDNIVVEWDTPTQPATTQVWYNVIPAPSPPPTGTTMQITYFIYLPLISGSSEPSYEFATRLELPLQTHHQAIIPRLQDGEIVRLVALSSYMRDNVIQTVASEVKELTLDIPPLTHCYLPIVQ